MSYGETIWVVLVGCIAFAVTVAGALKQPEKPGPCHGKRCGD